MPNKNDIIETLSRIDAGDPSAADELILLVYSELRELAAARLAMEKQGHMLDATALVHEAFLRLVDVKQAQSFENRAHFFAAASEAMRRILVESARRQNSQKRGGEVQRVEADVDNFSPQPTSKRVLEVHEALTLLSQKNETVAKLVEMKYFGGMTIKEASKVLKISARTAQRHFEYAKAWLRSEINNRR